MNGHSEEAIQETNPQSRDENYEYSQQAIEDSECLERTQRHEERLCQVQLP